MSAKVDVGNTNLFPLEKSSGVIGAPGHVAYISTECPCGLSTQVLGKILPGHLDRVTLQHGDHPKQSLIQIIQFPPQSIC